MNGIQKGRRRFLRQLLATPLLATGITPLLLMREALAAEDYSNIQDYRALVCVFLNGGNDAFNMLVPTAAARWNTYQGLRGDLAIPRNQLLPLAGTDHGFHPKMPNLKTLFDQGRLAIIGNLGNLVQPLTADQYRAWEEGDSSIQVPPTLFSHADQSYFWQTGHAPNVAQGVTGWGGRIGDLLLPTNGSSSVPVTMTLNGHVAWLDGNRATQLSLNSWNGIEGFEGFQNESWPPWGRSRTATWEALLDLHARQGGPLQKQLVEHLQRARSRAAAVREALDLSWRCDNQGNNCSDSFSTPYNADNNLAAQLRMVARMIHAREHLQQKRQIFVVALDGWDTHGSQAQLHPQLLETLDEALHSFQAVLQEMGMENQVTTFTASEFGRTLGNNGDGTDHGWGTHCLVMGGAVKGGQVHGELPFLERGSPLDVGDVLLPTLSTAQFGATLAKWMGIADADLDALFPHLHNFDMRDLGFMS